MRTELNFNVNRKWQLRFHALVDEGILDLQNRWHVSSLQAVAMGLIQADSDAHLRASNLRTMRSIKHLRSHPHYVTGIPDEIYADGEDCSISYAGYQQVADGLFAAAGEPEIPERAGCDLLTKEECVLRDQLVSQRAPFACFRDKYLAHLVCSLLVFDER